MEDETKPETEPVETAEAETEPDLAEEESAEEPVQEEPPVKEERAAEEGASKESSSTSLDEELKGLQMALGAATMKKQSILFELANQIAQLGPLEESIEAHHRNLNYVKSDISTDKTVCEVSGNFMSSRDADERIAAHYAGKQYVGWKLVRDKFAEMVKKFGRYGPPPPGRDGVENVGAMPPMGRGRGGGGGGNRYGDRGGFDRGGGGRGRYDGGGGYRGGGPDRGRWERGGPPPDYRDRRGPPRGNWRR